MYGDGTVQLFLTSDDNEIQNTEKKQELLDKVQNYITVYRKESV